MRRLFTARPDLPALYVSLTLVGAGILGNLAQAAAHLF